MHSRKAIGSNVAFRADASLEIGSGHIMRCLVLADVLAGQGARCTFICREHDGNLLSVIQERGHSIVPMSLHKFAAGTSQYGTWLGANKAVDAAETRSHLDNRRVDWLVVDHYGVDDQWEGMLRSTVGRILVIDDLADRIHDCDLLLDQNLGTDVSDYSDLVPDTCRTLIGPRFALLSPQFAKVREQMLDERSHRSTNRILITMGGVDKDNIAGWVLQELVGTELPDTTTITVIIGRTAPWMAEVLDIAQRMPWPTEVKVGVSNMAEHMALSDIAIGAAGSTSWERCCLGLPTVLMVLADNQRKIAIALERTGAVHLIDRSDPDPGRNLQHGMMLLCNDRKLRSSMSIEAMKICDGRGAERVVSAMMEFVS